jgi:hypothetical protein
MLCSYGISHERPYSCETYTILPFSAKLIVTPCVRSKMRELRKFLILGLEILSLLSIFDIRGCCVLC